MSSGKRASRFLKDKFTVHRFCFLPLSNVFFFLSHSFTVFVMDVVSYWVIILVFCTTMVKFQQRIRKIGLPFVPLFKVWTAISTCSMPMNGPNSFQSMDEERIAFHDNKLNWLIAQRYQILRFDGRFLPGFNLCKFWAKICASRKTVKTLIWFWQANCLFTNGMRLETARKLLISHASVIQWHFVQTISLFDYYNSFIATFLECLWI